MGTKVLNAKPNKMRGSTVHALTIHVTDLYKWLEMIVAVTRASRDNSYWSGEECLGIKWVYRGQANYKWSISSTFERAILNAFPEDMRDRERVLWEREKAAVLYFQQWAEIHKSQTPTTRGEWLALMQHYGVPTRLVDFTEVPLLALGFALEDENENDDFAIWMVPCSSPKCGFAEYQCSMREKKCNYKMLWTNTHAYRIESDDFDRNALEGILSDVRNAKRHNLMRYAPVGMSDRQKRQRGVFMAATHLTERFMPLLHGWTNTSPHDLNDDELRIELTDVMRSESRNVKVWFEQMLADARLIKCVFDKRLRKDAQVLLTCCNITGNTKYGGMEKLAEETKMLIKEGC